MLNALEKFMEFLEALSLVLDIVAEIIVWLVVAVLTFALLTSFVIVAWNYSTTLGIVILIIALSFLRVITR